MHTTTDNDYIGADEGTVGGDAMHIYIVGGGASGLSTLQAIMGTPLYKPGQWKPTLFETGGIW